MIDEEKQILLDEIEKLKKENENLLRIMRERSNKDRVLRPKTKHPGYIVRSSRRKPTRLKMMENKLEVWETTIETCYSTNFDFLTVQGYVQLDVLHSENPICLQLGISQCRFVEYEKLQPLEKTEINTLYAIEYRANYMSGYWEIILAHTLPIMVPGELKYSRRSE